MTHSPRHRSARHARGRRPDGALVVVLVVLLGVGGWLVSDPEDRDRAQALVSELWQRLPTPAGRIPLPEQRDYPIPGFEEEDAPLAEAPAAPAASDGFAFNASQQAGDAEPVGVRWSPCRPIHYVVDTTDAPDGFAERVRAEVAALTAVTGLVFVDDGVVVEAPRSDRAPFQHDVYGDRWVPVLIQFADPSTITDLVTAAGITSTQQVADPTTGVLHIVTGAVYLDVELLALRDAGGEPAYVPVLRHELGHLVGLGHVADAGQLMYPVTTEAVTYQAGDLAGLAEVGRGPCAPGL